MLQVTTVTSCIISPTLISWTFEKSSTIFKLGAFSTGQSLHTHTDTKSEAHPPQNRKTALLFWFLRLPYIFSDNFEVISDSLFRTALALLSVVDSRYVDM